MRPERVTKSRDNDLAYWVYTTAGDLAYATASNTLARLGKPSVAGVLKMTTTGVPSWVDFQFGLANNTAGFSTASGTLVDITSLSVTLTLNVQSTILVWISGNWVSASAGTGPYLCAQIDGVDDTFQVYTSLATNTHPFAYQWRKTGIAAGSRTIKGRAKSSSGTIQIPLSQMLVMAVPE